MSDLVVIAFNDKFTSDEALIQLNKIQYEKYAANCEVLYENIGCRR